MVRPRKNTQAFSLVEVIVAMAVVMFSVAFIYEQFSRTRLPSQRRLLMAQGRLLAHQELEELRACSMDDLRAWQPAGTFEPIESTPRYHVLRAKETRENGAIELTVTVGWDPNDEEAQHFDTPKTKMISGLRVP